MSGTVFLVAGEESGDTHGAGLIRELRARDPGLEFAGFGGPQMRELGGDRIEDWAAAAGVVGLWEVLKRYGYFRKKFAEALQRVADVRPSAVVFIDYPGFNLRLAKALAEAGDRAKRVYYISPQVWAWNRSRVPKMAKMLDRMLCIFPFEKDYYQSSGLETTFVGHPLADAIPDDLSPDARRDPGLVGLFPGSREREVAKLFPVMLDAAVALGRAHPGRRFIASAASHQLARLMEGLRSRGGAGAEDVAIETGTSRDLMCRAELGAVASGTATLEAAFCGMPYCLVYKVAPLTFVIGKHLVEVPHLGIVNILAGREVVPELVQSAATGERVAAELGALLVSPEKTAAMKNELRCVVGLLRSQAGAYGRAADAVLRVLEGTPEKEVTVR